MQSEDFQNITDDQGLDNLYQVNKEIRTILRTEASDSYQHDSVSGSLKRRYKGNYIDDLNAIVIAGSRTNISRTLLKRLGNPKFISIREVKHDNKIYLVIIGEDATAKNAISIKEYGNYKTFYCKAHRERYFELVGNRSNTTLVGVCAKDDNEDVCFVVELK
ncbi:hypothetical protein RJG79_08555 [Mycoplasmatota bacterium WC44]